MLPSHRFQLFADLVVFWSLGQMWMAQLVVYPIFAKVGAAEYVAYHGDYSRRIPWPVIVPGFATFFLPIALAFWGPTVPEWMRFGQIAAGLVSLLVTVGLAIPRHARLEQHGRDETTIAELVRYNWIRTVAMTAQSAMAMAATAHAFGGG